MEHNVWEILEKSKYTEEGIKEMERIYDFIIILVNKVGLLPMKELYNMWNENSAETYWILSNLTHPKE